MSILVVWKIDYKANNKQAMYRIDTNTRVLYFTSGQLDNTVVKAVSQLIYL